MKRRELLAAGVTLAVAGCLGGGSADSGQSSPEGTETTRPENREPTTAEPVPTTAGPAPTTSEQTAEPSETSPSSRTQSTNTEGTTETAGEPIPIPDAPTGSEKNASIDSTTRVTFAGDGSRIVVQGTIVAPNGCRTAVLESVRETESGLVVTVATEREAATGRACTLALVGVDYRFTVRRDSQPASVTVVHRGATGKRTMTTATP
jgi:hypothetical protein